MSNLNGIPSADYFETTLANTWNWTTGTVYVDEVPSASMPVGEYSYIVVNPWESNMQVAKIDWWDSDNRTFNVTDVVVDSWAWTQYTAKTHPLGAIVRFSNNYAFWKDIQTAVNTKADDSDISTVWKSNDYNDLDNIPTFALVATTGDYDDLSNTPTPITIDGADKILQLSWSNVLSATVTASYDSWTKKITLYGANSAVISEIDCTAFIKDGMIQNVQIVTDPAWYAPWKYLEFDFNTDSWVTDIYIALSDLAVYTAWEWISISSNAISVVAATASTLWWIKVGSWLSINSGTLSADSQTDENYTTAEKTKLAWIETWAEVNDIEKVQVNWTDLPISSKTVNVKIKTLNWEQIAWEWDLDIMARHYTEWTWICISCSDEISISSAYQTIISCKANCSDIPTDNCQLWNSCGYTTCTWTLVADDISNLAQCCDIPTDNCQLSNWCGYTTCTWTLVASDLNWYTKSCDLCTVATSWKYCDLSGTPTIPTDNCQLSNGCWYTTCTGTVTSTDLQCYAQCCDMVCSLTWADNSHYPSAKAVADALSCAWAWDMLASTYDPCNCSTDAFNYNNMYNKPTIPTDNCQLANSCWYTTCTGTLSTCSDITTALWYTPYSAANPCGYTTCTWTLSSCSDVITALWFTPYSCANPAWYTTCTWTLTASDLTWYAKSCDLATVATSGKYCDLTGRVTDNCQLANSCWYTTCTWTISNCAWVISALWYTPYNSSNPNWYTSCTGTLTAETVVSWDAWCTYTIKKSSVAPTSAWANTITLVV